MEHVGPFQIFSPIHMAWLHRTDAKGLDVTPSELDSIEISHPAAIHDPLFAEYRAREAAGLLRPRPGRKPPTVGTYVRLWFARMEIVDEVNAIRAKRRVGVERLQYNTDSPGAIAADRIAWDYSFYCTGKTLRARISKERHNIMNVFGLEF